MHMSIRNENGAVVTLTFLYDGGSLPARAKRFDMLSLSPRTVERKTASSVRRKCPGFVGSQKLSRKSLSGWQPWAERFIPVLRFSK